MQRFPGRNIGCIIPRRFFSIISLPASGSGVSFQCSKMAGLYVLLGHEPNSGWHLDRDTGGSSAPLCNFPCHADHSNNTVRGQGDSRDLN